MGQEIELVKTHKQQAGLEGQHQICVQERYEHDYFSEEAQNVRFRDLL